MRRVLLVLFMGVILSCGSALSLRVLETDGDKDVKSGKMECPDGHFCSYGLATNYKKVEVAKNAARTSAGTELSSTLFMNIKSIYGDHCEGETSECDPFLQTTNVNITEAIVQGSFEYKFYYRAKVVSKSEYSVQDKVTYDYYTYRAIPKDKFFKEAITVLGQMEQKAKKQKAEKAVKAIQKTKAEMEKRLKDYKKTQN